jgi:hypothetical protein
MKNFIIFAGALGILAGFGTLFPAFAQQIMPSEQPGMLLIIFGLTAMFLGLILLISSRDLKRRGIFVIWVGIFKIIAFVIMAYYGVYGNGGIKLVMGGSLDLIFGIIFLVALPKHLGVSLINLALDR